MASSACIITNQPQQKAKLSQFLKHHPLLVAKFPRTLQQVFYLTQHSQILLIIVAIKQASQTTKICHTLKANPSTKNIPIVLIKDKELLEKQQLADAYLTADFNLQDFNQVVRQLTIGY